VVRDQFVVGIFAVDPEADDLQTDFEADGLQTDFAGDVPQTVLAVGDGLVFLWVFVADLLCSEVLLQ